MQFDIIYTGDCLNLLKTLHDDIIRMKDKITLFS